MCRLENFLLLGDSNSEITEIEMKDFCETLMLTNQIGRFQKGINIESGLSDHHMMTIGVVKSFVPEQTPSLIRYRKFNTNNFGNELRNNLENLRMQNMKILNQSL